MRHAVFGMGITLINNWEIIRSKFCPDFAIDNNPQKRGTKDGYTGLKCYSLEDIAGLNEIEVLITAGDPYAVRAIADQLKELSIPFVVLLDKIDEWCKDIPLPAELKGMEKHGKKIILMNTPEHDNIGDHLIALSQIDFIKSHYPGVALYEITDIEYLWHRNRIKKLITSDDILIISGGGFMGSLWLYNCEDNIRKIITDFPDNKIIIFPQTVFFEDNERGRNEYEKSKEIYRGHHNIIFFAREKQSYQRFISILGTEDYVEAIPDIALFYKANGIKVKHEKRILVCLRNDKESVLPEKERKLIMDTIEKSEYQFSVTSMHEGVFNKAKRREQVEKKLTEIASAELVVTDTLHCMVMCALVGTECIFFDNISGKVKNVFKWIENNDYIHYCDNIDMLEKILNRFTPRENSFEFRNKKEFEDLICGYIEEAFT